MTKEQFELILIAILIAPTINIILINIVRDIYITTVKFFHKKNKPTKMSNDFVEALLEAVKQEKEKE